MRFKNVNPAKIIWLSKGRAGICNRMCFGVRLSVSKKPVSWRLGGRLGKEWKQCWNACLILLLFMKLQVLVGGWASGEEWEGEGLPDLSPSLIWGISLVALIFSRSKRSHTNPSSFNLRCIMENLDILTRMFPGKPQGRPEWHPVNLSNAGVFLWLNSCVCFLEGRKLSFEVVNEAA